MRIIKGLGNQRGFSTGCVLIGLLFFISIAYLGVKLGPSYMEYRVISNAVDEVVAANDILSLGPGEIKRRLRASIKRNSGTNPSKLDLNKISYLGASDGKRVIGVEYEVQVPLMYNVSVLMHFKHEKVSKAA